MNAIRYSALTQLLRRLASSFQNFRSARTVAYSNRRALTTLSNLSRFSTASTMSKLTAIAMPSDDEAKRRFRSRVVARAVLSIEQSEGRGARVRRSIGRPEIGRLDPFLLLDFFLVARPGGFPDHPHRGFETATYLLPTSKGSFQHEDSYGHKGILKPGDLQWMTAGRGVVHSEMPLSTDIGEGLQLWINLPAKDKMIKPAYQELKLADLPRATDEKNGVTAIVIAGESLGVKSKVLTRTPTNYIHFIMKPGGVVHQPIPTGWNSFAFILSGAASFGNIESAASSSASSASSSSSSPSSASAPASSSATSTSSTAPKFISAHHTVLLTGPSTSKQSTSETDGVTIRADEKQGCELVLVSGQPLNEPVAQMGPFVMNTREEIAQTYADYQEGKNGFEHAPGWKSEARREMEKQGGLDEDDEL